ncbi:hypothetical protein [Goodfellowiella coeruleoviolacea]|uniref:hypothetical protein n=1 Tax=Goodfellowiella coeruleoviolacea TaxID=334858 RepID=UPI0020A4ABDE|nr:hypothetical protein [Goodfellowiella coeruleoviolacea]
MNPNLGLNDGITQPSTRLLATSTCPDCLAPLDEPHVRDCDVARCWVTGLNRLSCDAEHDCGMDTWTGQRTELSAVHTVALGTGILAWCAHERISGRYGTVNLNRSLHEDVDPHRL